MLRVDEVDSEISRIASATKLRLWQTCQRILFHPAAARRLSPIRFDTCPLLAESQSSQAMLDDEGTLQHSVDRLSVKVDNTLLDEYSGEPSDRAENPACCDKAMDQPNNHVPKDDVAFSSLFASSDSTCDDGHFDSLLPPADWNCDDDMRILLNVRNSDVDQLDDAPSAPDDSPSVLDDSTLHRFGSPYDEFMKHTAESIVKIRALMTTTLRGFRKDPFNDSLPITNHCADHGTSDMLLDPETLHPDHDMTAPGHFTPEITKDEEVYRYNCDEDYDPPVFNAAESDSMLEDYEEKDLDSLPPGQMPLIESDLMLEEEEDDMTPACARHWLFKPRTPPRPLPIPESAFEC